MVIPVGPERGSQTLDLIEKAGKTAAKDTVLSTRTWTKKFHLSICHIRVNSCVVKALHYFNRVVVKTFFLGFFKKGCLLKKTRTDV